MSPAARPAAAWGGAGLRRIAGVADADSTCWTLIRGAAAGDRRAREAFALRYVPVVRAYLLARWRTPVLRERVEDAVQDAFLEFFRPDGVLARLDAARPGGFRPFLMGVLRNVARRVEERVTQERDRREPTPDLEAIGADDESLSLVLDRAWAREIVREAGERHRSAASGEGEQALRRVELLHLRFQDGLPIRDIATRWGVPAELVHHEYARARREFRKALESTVADYHGGTPEELEGELLRVLEAVQDRE